ncbi:MAG: rhomboid family intramembrane serine protease [Gemmataceae bacterium]|nr:rhomboid family intramembrane serine protease [Gemmataceae bacterium]MDW8266753.1 rhomboid family intramembrane serine protease [Gemmataceae bacterium]
MGFYDREYYREGPSLLGSWVSRAQVCKWLIGLNIAAFLLQMMTVRRGDWFTEALALDTGRLLHGEVWRLLTYAFLHDTGTWTHIVFNMLFLWWFGSDVEDVYGFREFLAIYLTSAVLGGVAYAAVDLVSGGRWVPCVGASGAVTAVMVLCALHFPNRIILLFFFLPVPIWLVVLFQVAQDSFIFLSGQRTSVAVVVHLGGAAFAYAYYRLHWNLTGLWAQLPRWPRTRARPQLRVYRGEDEAAPVVPASPPSVPETDEHLEAKLDAVLEKVARFGQASLTESERQILFRASEIFKRRRT